jgi:hypothetical protein
MGLFRKTKDKSLWPSALASIDEIGLNGFKVQFSGAYTVNGEYFSVDAEREFRSAADAEAWAARLEGSPAVTIKYDPDDPTENFVEFTND